MIKKYLTRRQFFNYGKLSLIVFLNSCSNSSKRITISYQNSFYPKSFKDTIPSSWQQENITFSNIELEKYNNKLSDSDFVLINDGWIGRLNFEDFQNINNLFSNDKLSNMSKDFLNNFEEYQSNKLFPIGIVPYAVVIKNKKDLISDAKESWDFLLSENLKRKIIFPQSPRILISIAKKISEKNSLSKLKSQSMLFDDQNALNWLINSEAAVAIMPYSMCTKYLNIDSRLSIVFPNQGVPLIWNFLLRKSKIHNQALIDWIKALDNKANIDALANQGWYLPFKNKYSQNKYNFKIQNNNFGPSEICWKNSWSFSPINDNQKLNLENFWNQSLTP